MPLHLETPGSDCLTYLTSPSPTLSSGPPSLTYYLNPLSKTSQTLVLTSSEPSSLSTLPSLPPTPSPIAMALDHDLLANQLR